jgi:hypothetical protein
MSKLTRLVNRHAADVETLPENSLQELERRLQTLTDLREDVEKSMKSRQENWGKDESYFERADRWVRIIELEAELIIVIGLYKQRQEKTATTQPKGKANLASAAPQPMVKTQG